MAEAADATAGARLGAVYVFRSRLGRAAIVAAYLAVTALFLIPLLWMLSTSFKQADEVFTTPIQWLPETLSFQNYSSAWNRYDFTRFAFNSLFVSLVVMASHVLLASMAGFGLAKYRFLGRNGVLLLILSTLMLPIEVLMVPMYLVMRDFSWLNTYQGLIVPTIADAFGVFLMRQFIRQVPDSLIEAARVEGAGDLRIFFRVVMPLCWPAVATLAIFIWRDTWDEFLWPFVIISDQAHQTIPLGIAHFQQSYVTDYGQLMAISVLATIPLAVIFLCFQRAFMRGIAMQGLKA